MPTALDADRARAQGRETTLAALQDGRRAYVARCGSCHQTYAPSSHPATEWPSLVDKMKDRAKLDDEDRARILEYLTVLADAPPAP